MNIIDRRLNASGKSLANRQRFLRRAKALAQKAVRESTKDRSIKDFDQGGEIRIPVDSLREPRLHRSGQGGTREGLLPGNKKFVQGDTIPKPKGGGGGPGQEGGEDGEGEDEFRFVLSQEEYLDLFFDDLELPDLAKKTLAKTESVALHRAGYSTSGSPANLSLTRTMRNSLSRRVALNRPKSADVLAMEAEIEALERSGEEPGRLMRLRAEHAHLVSRARRVPFIDPIDIRFRRFQAVPKPVAQAVMFCLMDTSASMTEPMKDLAKRFYALLYIFLKRRYRHVELVFVRHTHEAEEVDEDTFFHSAETGGTVVSSALAEMVRIAKARFPTEDWNIYAAQASDGDNSASDTARCTTLLREGVLPLCQYFAYLEVGRDSEASQMGFIPRATELWRTYEAVNDGGADFAMVKVNHRNEIYPVFRRLFERKGSDARRQPA
ncbi:YeaH/YhbH family protein [Lichenihabitans sp. Uapishka_5]|uniref:YeaH/YhbH family protein n=1 Tax=Lichenihabitans sp. Uapishka_5 TaxID=3037302 RepID=UPI0029E81C4A|nr:YeaH/YhbH family protein [Lichenihabitans sp. Uapishka_5]MDX7950181.1 YeaH/YhbH family protein [Lichenihabitans sp. Uapishka_5]